MFKDNYSFFTFKFNLEMGLSNFWYYTLVIVVILHIIVGFGYLMYKLSPKKKDKKDDE